MAAVMADQSTGENRGENRLEMALWSTTGVEKWLRELEFTEEIVAAFLGKTISVKNSHKLFYIYRSRYGW